MKVSVVIPIYRVEAFISRCVQSLMEQTLRDVEYIFVDDDTPDNSIRVLEDILACYPQRRNHAHILHHDRNKGLPAARNAGLALATGEFVFHCDSDDYVEPTMLEELYNFAKQQEADIVWCDWYLTFSESERYMKQPFYATSLEALKAQLGGAMKYNVWNKLVRRTLYTDNRILFPEGYGMGEDMTMMLLFVHASNVAYLPKAFYHYVKLNTGAFSQTYSTRHLEDIQHNVNRISDYIQLHYGETLMQELAFLKLEAKFPFLITDDWTKYHLWQEWYPEANYYISKNKNISFRNRMVQWCAWKRQLWLVWLYYKVVYKFVYGILYR